MLRRKSAYALAIAFLLLGFLAVVYYFREERITGYAILEDTSDPSLVIALTFDDKNDPWKDYSLYNHKFDVQGNVGLANRSFCKWYGCANMSDTDGSDYLNSTSKAAFNNGIAVSFWVYLNENPGNPSQAFFQIGKGSTLKWAEEGSYGISPSFAAERGEIGRASCRERGERSGG